MLQAFYKLNNYFVARRNSPIIIRAYRGKMNYVILKRCFVLINLCVSKLVFVSGFVSGKN